MRPEALSEIAELCGVTVAEVRGAATFYDMLHVEPVGTYLVAVCTNIACMLGGALELLEHAESTLGVRAGGHDDRRCVHPARGRVPGRLRPHAVRAGQPPLRRRATPEDFDTLVEDLARRPALGRRFRGHGTLVRVRRSVGLQADRAVIKAERAVAARGPRTPRAAANGEKKA